jgi:hypothetical protein
MDVQPPTAGDEIAATVTKRVPFGVLVEYADVPGLVRGATAERGAELNLRVLEYDSVQRRFSAELA